MFFPLAFVVELFLPFLPDPHLSRAISQARPIVDHAYAAIGVRVLWHFSASLPPDCHKSPNHRRIVFDFRPAVPGRSAAALAFAAPYAASGACITVLTDPLQTTIARTPHTAGILLGHVLAHEIGHVLQGIERHSPSGLMKQQWSPQEIQAMQKDPLRFSPYDTELILDAFHHQNPITPP